MTSRHPFLTSVSRVLVYVHRWLGIVLGLLFIGWFVSGIILMYVGMPRLSPDERRSRLTHLELGAATLEPGAAARIAGEGVQGLRLSMLGSRPVYHVLTVSGPRAFYADDGQPVAPVDRTLAMDLARRFAPQSASRLRYETRLTSPDQWTLEISRQLPLHRIAFEDPAGTRLYVSEATGEIVMRTTAASRRWAYPGAILHWIYLTPLRRHTVAWAQFVIWSSVSGTLMALGGLVWGLWRYSPRSAYRLRGVRQQSPYAGWMRWHHYAGLIFGVASVTWVFSGLLSMDPWDWHPSTAPSAATRAMFAGGRFSVEPLTLAGLRSAVARLHDVKEADIVQFDGRLLLASDNDVVSADTGEAIGFLTTEKAAAIARRALPDAAVADVTRLDTYDAYYYDRTAELPLPVIRVRYNDRQNTWLYIDGRRGTVLRKEETLTRVNRWLYHGLHSLDFPFLYYRRPLWDIVVIALSIGGLALTITPAVQVWRRLRRHMKRLSA